jgi:hypothetical protein
VLAVNAAALATALASNRIFKLFFTALSPLKHTHTGSQQFIKNLQQTDISITILHNVM